MPNNKIKRNGERNEHYGDHNFKGLGIIRCASCGGKLRDHPMRPCENLGVRLIHTDKLARSTSVAKEISTD